MRQPTEFELGWLAGFYEGEGNCSISNIRNRGTRKVQVHVRFYQKDLEPLLKARDILGISGSIHSARSGASCLEFTSAEARAVMRLMKPHLSQRRQGQVQRVLDAWDARPEKGRVKRGGSTNSPGQLRLIG